MCPAIGLQLQPAKHQYAHTVERTGFLLISGTCGKECTDCTDCHIMAGAQGLASIAWGGPQVHMLLTLFSITL